MLRGLKGSVSCYGAQEGAAGPSAYNSPSQQSPVSQRKEGPWDPAHPVPNLSSPILTVQSPHLQVRDNNTCLIGLLSVMVCSGCHNQGPQTGQLKQQDDCPTGLEEEVRDQGVGRLGSFRELGGKEPFQASLLGL